MQQCIVPEVILTIDPPSDLPVVPVQLYKGTLCVEYLIKCHCTRALCSLEHVRHEELLQDLSLFKRRENTIGSLPEAVDDLERRRACVPIERMQEWASKQGYFGIAVFSKNHPVFWIRNFRAMDISRFEFWDDLDCLFTSNQKVIIIQKPMMADLRTAQAIKLFTKPLCLFYFQYEKCERTNCTFLHRTEAEISAAIAKRYYELKALGKEERFENILRIDGLGQASQFSCNERLRFLLEEREQRKAEKALRVPDAKKPKFSPGAKE